MDKTRSGLVKQMVTDFGGLSLLVCFFSILSMVVGSSAGDLQSEAGLVSSSCGASRIVERDNRGMQESRGNVGGTVRRPLYCGHRWCLRVMCPVASDSFASCGPGLRPPHSYHRFQLCGAFGTSSFTLLATIWAFAVDFSFGRLTERARLKEPRKVQGHNTAGEAFRARPDTTHGQPRAHRGSPRSDCAAPGEMVKRTGRCVS